MKFLFAFTFILAGPSYLSPGLAQDFGNELLLSTSDSFRNSTQFVDFDGDGDIDILFGRSLDSRIGWAQNDGRGRFPGQRILANDFTSGRTESVHAADLDGDGDGDLDVLTTRKQATSNAPVGWYENMGQQTLGPFQVISTTPDKATLGKTRDLDGDGDLDVIVAGDGSNPGLYENLGGGVFGPANWVATGMHELRALEVGDINGDSLPDFVWCNGLGNEVLWAKNLGAGNFQAPTTITSLLNNPWDLKIGDLDGDNDLDVAVAARNENRLVWFENLNGITFSTAQDIDSNANVVEKLALGDSDGDGDLDVYSSSQFSTGVDWYQNPGTGSFGAPVRMGGNTPALMKLFAADLDGDGDEDPITVIDEVRWFESLGLGGFALQKDLGFHVSPGVPVDFDHDGDLDLLCTDRTDQANGKVECFENLGGGDFPGSELLLDGFRELTDADAADVAGDGDLDLIVGSGFFLASSSRVDCFENLGSGYGPAQNLRFENADYGPELEWVDLEGDGDPDVLVQQLTGAGSGHFLVFWLVNHGGGVITRAASLQIPNLAGFESADSDGDGRPDFLANRYVAGSQEVVLFRNFGSGAMGPAQV